MHDLVTIRYLKASNLVSYRQLSIEFEKGFSVIVGPNGSGKSSIVDGIYFALTGKSARGPDLVRHRRGVATVELGLDVGDGAGAAIYYSFEPGSTGVRVSSARLLVGGKLVASKKESMVSAVKELLGLKAVPRHDSFIASAVIVRQATFHSIAESLADPKRLAEILDAALGLQALVEAAKELAELELVYRDESTGEEVSSAPGKPDSTGFSRRYKSQAASLQRDKMEAERISARIREERRRVEELESQVREIEKALEEAERLVSEIKAGVGRLEAEKKSLEESVRRLEELERRISEERARIERLRREEERLREEAEPAGLQGVVAEARRLEAEAGGLRARLAEALRLLRLIEEAEEARRLAEGSDVRERLARVEEALRELRARAEQLRSKVKAAEAAERELKEAARMLGVRAGGARSLLEAIRGKAERLRSEAERLEREAAGLRSEAARLRGEAERARRALELLESSKGARCPLCGSPLEGGRLEAVRRHLSSEARARLSEAERLEGEADRLEARARSVGEEARRAEALLERLSAAVKLAGGVEVLEGLEGLRRELVRAEESLSRLEREAARLREEAGRVEEARRRLAKLLVEAEAVAERLGLKRPPTVEEARRLVAGLEGKLGSVESRLESIMGELRGRGYSSLDEAEEAVRRALRAREELGRVEAERRAAEERLGELSREADSLRPLRPRYEEVSRRLEEERARLREAESLAAEAREAFRSFSRELVEAKGRLGGYERELEKLKARIELRRRLLASMTVSLAVWRILVSAKELSYLEALARIEDEMNRILHRLRLPGVASVEIERGFEGPRLRVRDQEGRAVNLAAASGGEKTALALAFILALNKAVMNRIGFLILDEPTADLDRDRRRELVETLRRAAAEGLIKQVILVTHSDDVVDMADVVYRVYRSPEGYSVVEREV